MKFSDIKENNLFLLVILNYIEMLNIPHYKFQFQFKLQKLSILF